MALSFYFLFLLLLIIISFYFYLSSFVFNHLVIIFSLICIVHLIYIISWCTYDANKRFSKLSEYLRGRKFSNHEDVTGICAV